MNEMTRNLLIAAVLTVAVGGIVLWQKNATPVGMTTGTATTTPAGGITMEEVATHSTRTDCWSVINGGVYDLTSWVPQHPGGEQAILGLCGTDGSARFNGQHAGGQSQLAILAGFKIGEIGGAAAPVTAGSGTQVTAPAPVVPVDDRGRGRGRGGDDE